MPHIVVSYFGFNSKVKLCHLTSCCISIPGENCEVSSRLGRCVSGVCKNGGRCVDLLVGGFMCQCPDGDFEKPYCRMSTRSFPGNAFVTFRGLKQRFHFTLSFMWVTPCHFLCQIICHVGPVQRWLDVILNRIVVKMYYWSIVLPSYTTLSLIHNIYPFFF